MNPRSGHWAGRVALWLVGLSVVAVVLTLVLRPRLPDVALPDFVCFWTAGHLLAAGENPYDPGLQEAFQKRFGYRDQKLADGRVLKFNPYYYPPWFGLLCTSLLPLDFATGRAAWLAVNLELLFLSGWLLRPAIRNLSGVIVAALVTLFAFSQYGLWMAQTSPLALFLTVVAWRLMEGSWDRSAGVALAWLAFKPQLAAVVLLGLLVWAAYRRRWGVLQGLVVGLVVLGGVSFLFVPDWPLLMLNAPRVTPIPTDEQPRIGSTWLLVLRSVGVTGPWLWMAYAAVVLPLLVALLWTARWRPLLDVVALSCIVVFFVSPYSQAYDFALLAVPWLVLLDGQPTPWRLMAVLLALLVLPVLHLLFWLNGPQEKYVLFWVPTLLAVLWLEREVFRANLSTH